MSSSARQTSAAPAQPLEPTVFNACDVGTWSKAKVLLVVFGALRVALMVFFTKQTGTLFGDKNNHPSSLLKGLWVPGVCMFFFLGKGTVLALSMPFRLLFAWWPVYMVFFFLGFWMICYAFCQRLFRNARPLQQPSLLLGKHKTKTPPTLSPILHPKPEPNNT